MSLLPRRCLSKYKGGVLSGCGPSVEYYCTGELVASTSVFGNEANHISSVEIDERSGTIFVIGERSLAIVEESDGEFVVCKRHRSTDFILAVNVLKSGLVAVLYMCNRVVLYENEPESLLEKLCISSQHSALLISGLLVGSLWDEMLSVVGTVFGEILISCPAKGSEVLRKVEAHTGMVFDLHIHDGRLFSVSDDRSFSAWNITKSGGLTAIPVIERFAHSARPFAIASDDSGNIYTAGVDEVIFRWSCSRCNSGDGPEEYRVTSSLKTNVGGIRSLLCTEQHLYVGSENGGLVQVELSAFVDLSEEEPTLVETGCDALRGFARSLNGLYTVDKVGTLYLDSQPIEGVRPMRYLVSVCGNTRLAPIAVAYTDNDVAILGKSIRTISSSARILVCLTTNEHIFVYTCDAVGDLFNAAGDLLLQIDFAKCLKEMHRSKVLMPSSMLYMRRTEGDILLIGSRTGQLFYCRVNSNENCAPVTSIEVNRCLAGASVMEMKQIGNDCVHVLSKNGRQTLLQMCNDTSNVKVVESSFVSRCIDFDWPCQFVEHGKEKYIVGFHSTNFVVIDACSRLPLAQFECGGGNRTWACHVDADDSIVFQCIKQQELVRIRLPLRRQNVICDPIHTSQIVAVSSAVLQDGSLLTASIGKDNLFVFTRHFDDGRHEVTRKWFEADGLCSLSSFYQTEGGFNLLTGTDKGCLQLWHVDIEGLLDGDILSLRLLSSVPRANCCRLLFVSFEVGHVVDSTLRCVAVFADGTMEVYQVNSQSKQVELTFVLERRFEASDRSLYTKAHLESNRLFAISTSGRLSVWSLESKQAPLQIVVEKCGLSALRLCGKFAVVGTESGRCYIVRRDDDRLELCQTIDYHAATVTDIHVEARDNDLLIYSISLDCRLVCHCFYTDSQEVSFVKSWIPAVWDPAAISITNSRAVVVGSAFEVLHL